MSNSNHLPLLLLDNSGMITAMNEGEFKCTNLTFDEAKHIIEVYDEADVLQCFNNKDIETVIYDYLGVTKRDFPHKRIRNMRPGQDAIVFKLLITSSETQPIIETEGVQARKIQNIYVYCQYISRIS